MRTIASLLQIVEGLILKIKKKKLRLKRLRTLEEAQRKALKEWLTQNEVEVEPYLKMWTDKRERVSREIVDKFVACLAFADGMTKAIDIIKNGMGLEKLDFNTTKLNKSIDKILMLQCVRVFLNNSKMTKSARSKLWELTLKGEYDETAGSKVGVEEKPKKSLFI